MVRRVRLELGGAGINRLVDRRGFCGLAQPSNLWFGFASQLTDSCIRQAQAFDLTPNFVLPRFDRLERTDLRPLAIQVKDSP